jgi:hypothetical protein
MQTSIAPENIRTFVPPHPDPAPENLSPRQLLTLMRTNNLRVWSQRAYEDEMVVRRIFGRSSVIFNASEAIRHVLVDHPETYGRSRATPPDAEAAAWRRAVHQRGIRLAASTAHPSARLHAAVGGASRSAYPVSHRRDAYRPCRR